MSWSPDSIRTHLTLVRHGQASYLEGDDYDRLSAVGERQARRLGEYWADRGSRFDLVFSGPAERHRRTAEIAIQAAAYPCGKWPETLILPDFDEFPGEQVVRRFGPVLAERHEHIREMADAFESAVDKPAKKRALDVLFHEVAGRWVREEVSSSGVESWKQFTDRIGGGVEQIRRLASGGRTAVVFTSAGPTAAVASLALDIAPAKTLELAFAPRNASFSEFSLTGAGVELISFNNSPHLTEPELLTWR